MSESKKRLEEENTFLRKRVNFLLHLMVGANRGDIRAFEEIDKIVESLGLEPQVEVHHPPLDLIAPDAVETRAILRPNFNLPR